MLLNAGTNLLPTLRLLPVFLGPPSFHSFLWLFHGVFSHSSQALKFFNFSMFVV